MRENSVKVSFVTSFCKTIDDIPLAQDRQSSKYKKVIEDHDILELMQSVMKTSFWTFVLSTADRNVGWACKWLVSQ